MIIAAEDEFRYLEEVQHRAKKRRIAFGLDDQLEPVRLDRRETASVVYEPTADEHVDLTPLQRKKSIAYGPAYLAGEETLRPNLAQEYVNDNRRRPQNALLNCDLKDRFNEYPKLKRLLQLHTELVENCSVPPTYLSADLHSFDLTSLLPTRFDCILIDRPDDWTWEEIASLPIPSVAATPSFIWIWCGKGNDAGLEKGRALLARWGYRRCEDIVWLKTNKHVITEDEPETNTIFTQTKEHCLQGIRGTVRRSTESVIAHALFAALLRRLKQFYSADYVHCNVDTDVIVWEGDPDDRRRKPPELYSSIENFCLGNRRLQLFGSPKDSRLGWLTIGVEEFSNQEPARTSVVGYNKETFDAAFEQGQVPLVVPNTPEVDALRPKSPHARGNQSISGGGIGRGRSFPQNQKHSPNPSMQAQFPTRYAPTPPVAMPMPQMPNPGFMNMPITGFGMPPMMNPMMMMNPAMNPMAMMNSAPMDWTAFFQNQNQAK